MRGGWSTIGLGVGAEEIIMTISGAPSDLDIDEVDGTVRIGAAGLTTPDCSESGGEGAREDTCDCGCEEGMETSLDPLYDDGIIWPWLLVEVVSTCSTMIVSRVSQDVTQRTNYTLRCQWKPTVEGTGGIRDEERAIR